MHRQFCLRGPARGWAARSTCLHHFRQGGAGSVFTVWRSPGTSCVLLNWSEKAVLMKCARCATEKLRRSPRPWRIDSPKIGKAEGTNPQTSIHHREQTILLFLPTADHYSCQRLDLFWPIAGSVLAGHDRWLW